MDRDGLADFLRRRREALRPAEVGLPSGMRRRTPGLRRDEVAVLAGMSTDYYGRLEQRRGPHPSAAILAALARALRLSDDERDHLFYLADQAPPARHSGAAAVRPGLLHILDCLHDAPAFIISDTTQVLVQNRMSVLLSGDQVGGNFTWIWFTDPAARQRAPQADWDNRSRSHVADLRATAARRRGDEDVESLIRGLQAASPEFAQLWAEHEVAVRHSDRKRFVHPEVGLIDLGCERLSGDVDDQTLVVMYPCPGTDARDRLDLLRVIGLQDLAPTH